MENKRIKVIEINDVKVVLKSIVYLTKNLHNDKFLGVHLDNGSLLYVTFNSLKDCESNLKKIINEIKKESRINIFSCQGIKEVSYYVVHSKISYIKGHDIYLNNGENIYIENYDKNLFEEVANIVSETCSITRKTGVYVPQPVYGK